MRPDFHTKIGASDTELAPTWRRRWDSNPRAGNPANAFRVFPPSVTYMVSPVSFSQSCTPANPHKIWIF